MTTLITSDLHLTDNYDDEYRWDIFKSIIDEIQKNDITKFIILGDLTEEKGFHSAELVNRLIKEFLKLFKTTRLQNIYILKGNHDYLDEKNPFFEFLGNLPNIHFITTPSFVGNYFFIPHKKEMGNSFLQEVLGPTKKHNIIFMHKSFSGVKLSNNIILKQGTEKEIMDGYKYVISGDIHIPQKLGNIIYVGAPYPIYFGDSYIGRFLLLDEDDLTTIPIKSIKKDKVELFSPWNYGKTLLEYKANDQIRVYIYIKRDEISDFLKIKEQIFRQCEERNIKIKAIECCLLTEKETTNKTISARKKENAIDILNRFCEKENLTESYTNFAKELL